MFILGTMPWYQLDGILEAISKMLLEAEPKIEISKESSEILLNNTLEILDHSEVRLRENSGKLLSNLVKMDTNFYTKIHEKLLKMIENYMIREDSSKVDPTLVEKLKPVPSKPSGERINRDFSESGSTAEEIFHESAGWRHLETSLKALQSCLEVVKAREKAFSVTTSTCNGDQDSNTFVKIEDFVKQIDLQNVNQDQTNKNAETNNFLETIYKTLVHSNRFVRQTGYEIMESLVEYLTDNERFLRQLARGLSDNWSQVRMASSVAARTLFDVYITDSFLDTLDSTSTSSTNTQNKQRNVVGELILPRVCLNRYYVAAGVRNYNQQTWRKLIDKLGLKSGKKLVVAFIDNYIDYYIDSTKADKHAVREAACACICEFSVKLAEDLDRDRHVKRLLITLLDCFKDDSWPVRDAACLAMGDFVDCFGADFENPDQPEIKLKEQVKSSLINNLKDAISSVRQGAATSLGKYLKKYPTEFETFFKSYILTAWEDTKNQKKRR